MLAKNSTLGNLKVIEVKNKAILCTQKTTGILMQSVKIILAYPG